ncbi:hypothetical protein SAMN03159338_1595 [Sphingomonas sp. NFR04]|uniref:hypothetical protein n=1 Tax=Sphingomonas sp. NFR04 TaxID=1566283 RepID=UPI0008EEC95A|nr:hypothetical protein [Sphingomonas sp. NFR04]SFJ50495.1 hypothetical protein SAMN03159338_1595 [Sphingomonas sp. NFR04]
MGRQLSVASVIDKNKVSSDTAWVILLEVNIVNPNTRQTVDTIRIARNPENIVFGVDGDGKPRVFLAGNFSLNVDQKQNEAPSVSIEAQDQTGFIQRRMEEMAGGIFSEAVMIVLNTARLDRPVEFEERFQIVTSSVKDYAVSFTLGAENLLNIAFPKHRQSKTSCAWRFRGYGCGYTGAETVCDYTRDGPRGCAVKGNLLNFRALTGLVRMNL